MVVEHQLLGRASRLQFRTPGWACGLVRAHDHGFGLSSRYFAGRPGCPVLLQSRQTQEWRIGCCLPGVGSQHQHQKSSEDVFQQARSEKTQRPQSGQLALVFFTSGLLCCDDASSSSKEDAQHRRAPASRQAPSPGVQQSRAEVEVQESTAEADQVRKV